jgi:hypothetical protein
MIYAVVKVFFSNLKRGGILLIQIAVGSLYMFSVPRGYIDGFVQWCKQIVGLCLTAFLQVTILVAVMGQGPLKSPDGEQGIQKPFLLSCQKKWFLESKEKALGWWGRQSTFIDRR